MDKPDTTNQLGIDPGHYVVALYALAAGAQALIHVAGTIDLRAMSRHLATMDTIAPLLEPTAYNRGGELNLRDQETFLDATIAYIDTIRTLDRR